jgi:hypothetical protein
MSFSKNQLHVCLVNGTGDIQIVCDNPTTATEIASQAKSEGFDPKIHGQVVVTIRQPLEQIQALLKRQNFNLECYKYVRMN